MKGTKKDQKIILAIALVAVVITAYLVYTQKNSSDTFDVKKYVPAGYQKTEEGIFTPDPGTVTSHQVTYSAEGFSEPELNVSFGEKITMASIEIENKSANVLVLKIAESPNDEYSKDPPVEIPAGSKVPYILSNTGKYILQNQSNQDHKLSIIIN